MDISVKFDFQELKNAVEQAKKEIVNRYDLKDSHIEVELNDDSVKVNAASEVQLKSVYEIVVKRMAGRGLSPKILDPQKIEEAGGMRFRQEFKLIKALDSENAKKISKIVRDFFPKAKPFIQGETVRVNSASIDELQAIIAKLKADPSFKVPLDFGNYR